MYRVRRETQAHVVKGAAVAKVIACVKTLKSRMLPSFPGLRLASGEVIAKPGRFVLTHRAVNTPATHVVVAEDPAVMTAGVKARVRAQWLQRARIHPPKSSTGLGGDPIPPGERSTALKHFGLGGNPIPPRRLRTKGE